MLDAFDNGTDTAFDARDGDNVGQVILARRVVVADLIQHLKGRRPVERHHPGVAKIGFALNRRGVLGFNDALKSAI